MNIWVLTSEHMRWARMQFFCAADKEDVRILKSHFAMCHHICICIYIYSYTYFRFKSPIYLLSYLCMHTVGLREKLNLHPLYEPNQN